MSDLTGAHAACVDGEFSQDAHSTESADHFACMNSDSHFWRRRAEYLVDEFSTAVAQSGYYSNYHL